MNDALTLTESAAVKIWELIQEDNNPQLKLRAYVTGGGCSGFQYGFSFDEQVDPDTDTLVTKNIPEQNISVSVVVDEVSLQYLTGAEIDYKEDIEGSQFIIRNPNAKTTCGCGSSFSA